jgi:hypothetical protein
MAKQKAESREGMTMISLSLPRELHRRLNVTAFDHDMAAQELIRRALVDYLDRLERKNGEADQALVDARRVERVLGACNGVVPIAGHHTQPCALPHGHGGRHKSAGELPRKVVINVKHQPADSSERLRRVLAAKDPSNTGGKP